ncbi:MAG: GNAT family N-acetyltransferase [Flavobacteriaceae bacterium]|jgi:ribosomal protein S18 acetylase RimI-like enzyme|nr:GNAT family N-acetyltransferase [Flavobacteriaceae bacterium]
MLVYSKITKETEVSRDEIKAYTVFLYQHLEQYGDTEVDIAKAIAYALGHDNKPGGFIMLAHTTNQNIVGIGVLLDTLMEGFIPEHILVYLAIDSSVRGQGIGGKMLDVIQQEVKGNIALHVDNDNPAQDLYERKGFEKKYIEMRWIK